MNTHTKPTTMRALIIIAVPSVLFLLYPLCTVSSPNASPPYNVVLIVSDTFRGDAAGCYGGHAQTPHIDALARNGLLYENAHSTAPCTLPSATAIMTGHHSRSYRVKLEKKSHKNSIFYINQHEPLLSKTLKKMGYDIKMDVENPGALRSNGFQGFTHFRGAGRMAPEEIRRVEDTLGITHPTATDRRLYDFLHYVLTVPKEKRFFLVKWIMDPHAPYNPPEKWKQKIPTDPSTLSQTPEFYTTSVRRDFQAAIDRKAFTSADYAHAAALYRAEVETVDQRVGYILKALKIRGLDHRTIVVFTSDHGELFGEHHRMGHGMAYWRQLMHVPLIMAGPGIPKGKREKSPWSHVDLMPTLKGLLGITAPFKGNRDFVYYDNVIQRPRADYDALLMGDYKLVATKKGEKNVFRLYRLSDDPGEQKDLAPQNPGMVRNMYRVILDLRQKNETHRQQNRARIDKSIDLENEHQKTVDKLRALGYIDHQ